MNKMLKDPNVKLLIDTFNLDTPPTYRFEISDYELVDDKIVINSIKVFDSENKFIKFADLKKVFKYLKHTDTSFNNDRGIEDTSKDNQEARS